MLECILLVFKMIPLQIMLLLGRRFRDDVCIHSPRCCSLVHSLVDVVYHHKVVRREPARMGVSLDLDLCGSHNACLGQCHRRGSFRDIWAAMVPDFNIVHEVLAVLVIGVRDAKGGARGGTSPHRDFHFFSL